VLRAPTSILIVGVMLLFAVSPRAQEATDSEPAENRAWDLLRAVAEATGGEQQIAGIASLVQRAEVTLINNETNDSLKLVDSIVQVFPFHEARATMTVERDRKQWQILAGGAGWRGAEGSFEPLTEIQVRNSRRSMEKHFVNVLGALDDPYYEIEFRGEDSLLGNTYYRLDFTTDSDYKFSWYIDPLTNQLRGHTVTLVPENGFVIIEKYHVVDGVLMPKRETYRSLSREVLIEYTLQGSGLPYDSSIFNQP